jgi:hypothetical protein
LNPLNFVGTPDWRSAVLALVFAAPWLILLADRWLRHFWLWAVLAAGVLLFPLSIAWVQVPIQQAINALYLRSVPVETIQRYLLIAGVPPVLVAGLVQEAVKFGDAVVGLYLVHEPRSPRAGLALGAAAGAGYGAMEAFWILNQIFASGFTWATVQLGGIAALLGFIERFFTVMFHTAIAALAAYGFASGRPWRYLLLAIVVHALADYLAILLQAKLLSPAALEVVIGIIAVGTLAAAVRLRVQVGRSADA